MTYYCRDTFGEVQLGEITDESNITLAKDQIFLSTDLEEEKISRIFLQYLSKVMSTLILICNVMPKKIADLRIFW